MPCPLKVLSCPMSAILLLFFCCCCCCFLSDVDFVKGSIRHVRFIPPVKVSVDPVHFGFSGQRWSYPLWVLWSALVLSALGSIFSIGPVHFRFLGQSWSCPLWVL